MTELFVYDWYIELKLLHSWIRNTLCSVENGLEVLVSASSNFNQKVNLTKGKNKEAVFQAIDLLASYQDYYYPVDRSSGETLQDVVRNTWGVRQEGSLSDFAQPISVKCMALSEVLDDLKGALAELISLDDIPSDVHTTIYQTIESLGNILETIFSIQREIEAISQKGGKGILIWENQRYPAPLTL